MTMQATIRLEHELLAVEGEHTVSAMLELSAPPTPGTHDRPPLHLALVIDRSGSMAGRKLDVTKQCALYLVRRLRPEDELSLITYDDQVDLVLPLMPVGSAPFESGITGILPGGSTNLSGGWLKGMEQLKAASGQHGPRKVLLLTDGLANVGITDPPTLVSMASKAAGAGIGTTTVGFGEDFDEDLLTAMADAGGGSAHYAASPEEVPAIFAREFEDLVRLVAQNVSVEIRPATDRVQMLGVLNDYPVVPVAGGLQVQLGDAYGEERRRVVFQLHVPRLASLGLATVAEVVVRYVSVGQDVAAHELTLPLVVNMVSADEATKAGPDGEVVEEILILKAARAQREAREKADQGDFDSARKLLTTTAQELRAAAPGSSQVQELLEQAEMLEVNLEVMSPVAYSMASRKQMKYQSRQSRRRPDRR